MFPRAQNPDNSRSPARDRNVLRRAVIVLGVFAPALFVSLSGVRAASGQERPKIDLVNDAQAKEHFQVMGVPPKIVAQLKSLKSGDQRWNGWFSIYIGKSTAPDRLPILGDYRVEDDKLVFEPRFPLRAGASYTAVWRGEDRAIVKREFAIPAAKETPPATVAEVYPTRNVLPENQLKFYLHFSAPMSRGEAYRRIHLFKESGEEVEFPFLELGEELWDDSQTRFTLFFDPGRIKRGLKPREEVGPSLVEGESYTLVIDKGWLDARGRPLKESFRKSFRASAPDDVQPDVKKWKLTPPEAGSDKPLVVLFDEPLDHAMLHRVLSVVDAAGKAVAGEAHVDREETRWTFQPKAPWKRGQHQFLVESTLEDLAGNSLAKPFEVDVFRPIQQQVKTETERLPFEVR